MLKWKDLSLTTKLFCSYGLVLLLVIMTGAISWIRTGDVLLEVHQLASLITTGTNGEEAIRLQTASEAIVGKVTGIRQVVLWLCLATLSMGGLITWFTSRNVGRGLAAVARVNQALTRGEMTARCEMTGLDEFGMLASSCNQMGENFSQMCRRIRGSSSTVSAATETLNSLATGLANSAEEMAKNCNGVAVAAEEMNANMSAIAAASEQISTNVNMVASASEEMNATITEIAGSAQKARQFSEASVREADAIIQSVEELSRAAEAINKVTETINEIADQTNLLALNATIEAARAGEAGKGFAVVANEIKELANQTTMSTKEIRERIEGVQSSTQQTIERIGAISKTVTETSEIVSGMSSAVEEQAISSREITTNISQASQGMQEVNSNIAQASQVNSEVTADISRIKMEADEVACSSGDVRELSGEMRANAAQLSSLLASFSFKEAQFDVGKIKIAHFNWKMRLTAVLGGYKQMQAKDVPNHHQCDFGKWYDSAPKSLTALPVFAEVGKHHEQVHRKVAEVIEAFNRNDKKQAMAKLEDFEQVRKKLFDELDNLYMQS